MSSSDNAVKEFKWFVIILIIIGVVWISFGGLKSLTKEDPYIKPAEPLNTGKTYGRGNWLSFLFPWLNYGTSTGMFDNLTPDFSYVPSFPNDVGSDPNGDGTNIYGADKAPGPITKVPDKISIGGVSYSGSESAENEYVRLSAPSSNKGKILLTGMLLKSRMTGKQQDIGEGVNIYYPNTINYKEPIFLGPGETAYIISRRSPLGYSFRINKCFGYLNAGNQNFVVDITTYCPHILDYPLPARPNAFNDKCLDFLNSIGTCQSNFYYTQGVDQACKNFVIERANYTRCVTDFKNDGDFLEKSWRIYLGRDDSLWKSRREIVDLIDQNGQIVDTYTY